MDVWEYEIFSMSDEYWLQGLWIRDGIDHLSDYEYVYYYAKNVIRGRCIEGEALVLTSPAWAYQYARDVIKDRWHEAEMIILSDLDAAYLYADDVVRGRWIEAEPIFMQDPEFMEHYEAEIKNRTPRAIDS